MLKFFRTIRQKLLAESRFTKYLIYAVGEIFLVVIGILIALQVNNWNESSNRAIGFKTSLTQLYTAIKIDSEYIYSFRQELIKQIEWIDKIQQNPNSIESKKLLHILYYLDTNPEPISSETAFHLANLEFDPNDKGQNQLAEQISSFVNNGMFTITENRRNAHLAPLLEALGIPSLPTSFRYTSINNFEDIDTSFFSTQDVEDLNNLLTTRAFHNALKSLKLSKQLLTNVSIENYYEDSQSILKSIQQYYPKVKLLLDDIGIIGNALETDWYKSVPMNLVDAQKGIWTLNVQLKDGFIKFRARDSWKNNWGGNLFPTDRLIMNGNNIPVEAGYYKVEINLEDNLYSFTKMEQ